VFDSVNSNTQFALPSLGAIPPQILSSYYLQGQLPPSLGFPFTVDAACLAACTGGAAAAAPAASWEASAAPSPPPPGTVQAAGGAYP